MGNKELRAAIYLRVSSDRQTIENQRLELERIVAQRGWKLVETYADPAISGVKGRDQRPAFDRVCTDAARGKLDVIMVWAIDRLGRSLAQIANCLSELRDQNVAAFILQQNVDGTTASGKAMLGMCAVFAEFERDMLIERVNAGLARARAQGKKLGRPTTITGRTERRIRELAASGLGKVKIGRTVGCGTSTVQRVLKAA